MFFLQQTAPDHYPAATVRPPTDTAIVLSAAWAERKVPLSRGHNIRGYHPVRPGHGAIVFESLIERDTISLFASQPEVEKIVSQPVTIYYMFQKRRFRYTPDLMVVWRDVPSAWADRGFEKRTFIECKPHEKLDSLGEALTRSEAAMLAFEHGPRVLVTRRELSSWGRTANGH